VVQFTYQRFLKSIDHVAFAGIDTGLEQQAPKPSVLALQFVFLAVTSLALAGSLRTTVVVQNTNAQGKGPFLGVTVG